MQYDPAGAKVVGETTFAKDFTAASATLHVRLPSWLSVKSVNPQSKACVLPDGSAIRWTAPQGTVKFEAVVVRVCGHLVDSGRGRLISMEK
jgi:hypothetical protein